MTILTCRAIALFAGLGLSPLSAAEPTFEQVRPLLKEFCLNCHSTEKQKGDLDLEVFTSLESIKRHPKIWQGVAEQLENREMPPKNKPQPSPEQRALLSQWTATTLETMARERAGDPGPVVLRRLSNAEYTYTVRDLTGVESLDPVREFPADGAAGEGFTNTGQALVMSPALLSKYLDAGKAIAAHAVLLPDGIRFSPSTNKRDWTEEILSDIRGFYRRFTTAGGAKQVNLQGIKFETNGGGRIPLEKYLGVLLKSRNAPADGKEKLETIAAREGLNAKYLALLSQSLTAGAPSWLMDDLRTRWRAAKPGDEKALATEIERWQEVLWKFNTAGHIGVPGKATEWMAPANPMLTRMDFRRQIQPVQPGETMATIYLVAAGVGEQSAQSGVVWEKPRLVKKGQPDALLHDLAPELFKNALTGETIDPTSLLTPVGSTVEVRLPAEAANGAEFMATARLPKDSGEARVHPGVIVLKPAADSAAPRAVPTAVPLLIADGAAIRREYEEGFAAFRELFPAALCYEKIIPSDEVVTLLQFYREDHQLARLMLSDAEKAQLDRMWTALRFVTRDPLTQVDALLQIIEYATQDSDPKPFRAARPAFEERAASFRQALLDAEPRQLEAVLELADRAYRRPLRDTEKEELRALYRKLRSEELPHEEALRLTIAKVFVSPAFLYRSESPAPSLAQAPVSADELANRLSYFLTSSLPDAELRIAAASGRLPTPAVLRGEMQRLLAGPRVRRLATEFGCQWLHLRDFDSLDEKSDAAFPTFRALRGDMLEESVRFFTDLFQHDGSVLSLLDSDHAFLNEALAKHYGIPGVSGPDWRRVEGARRLGRGGLLGQAAVLAKQAGASRSSPILRGDFVVETLLGEKIPRPPKDVPPFPEEQAGAKLTVRQLTEKHSSDERCARCHLRMDAFGFALENFDAIGRFREKDEAGTPLDAHAKLPNGTELAGLPGLRDYLLHQRRDDFLRQFCRKLLGFALGRAVQLSDEPLLTDMRTQLAAHEFRVSAAVDCIVQSRQFRDIRGAEMKDED
ncbi:MAG TPA: DUF1592 domain-containing protein [Chthoniobacteraceae bacterium]|jgi:hypothetical protein|nr:DUF1592 domain-containing protein [Chthoniobacteraceae bacterium]